MKKCYVLQDRKLALTESGPAILTMYVAPDEGEKKCLLEELKLDEHTLASAFDADELSRLEFEPEHAALIVKRPKNFSGDGQIDFKVGSVGAYLFKDRLLVVCSEDIPLVGNAPVIRVSTPAGLLLSLLYRFILHFREHLKIINTISNELQGEVNTSMSNKHLINLFEIERSLVYYLNAINSNSALIDKIKHNTPKFGFSAEEQELLDDIQIENAQCSRQAEIYSNIIAGLMDARASIVSNNLNVLMKTLTIITITIMLPNLVVSMFSINVKMPFGDENPYAFWIVNGMALLSVAAVIFVWRWKRL